MISHALHFDGSSALWIEDTPALRFTTEMTFQAWIKLDEPIVSRTFGYLLSKNEAGIGYDVEIVDRPNHRLNAMGFYDVNQVRKPSIPLGQWVHIAFARSMRRAVLYVDGKEACTFPTGEALRPNELRLWIGSSPFVDQEGQPCRLIGAMDEVQLWNVARSQRNIERSMRRRPSGREKSLIVYLSFDQRPGQSVPNLARKTSAAILGRLTTPDPEDPTWVEGPSLRR